MSQCKCGHEVADHSDRALIACAGKGEERPITVHSNSHWGVQGTWTKQVYTCGCVGYEVAA